MKALVTGGAGFIGSHLVDALLKRGHAVTIFDDLSTGKRENINERAMFHDLDIARPANWMKNVLSRQNTDVVFHLAALPRVAFSIANPLLTANVNVMGTLNVFKVAIDAGVKRIVFASSSSVYGDRGRVLMKEFMTPFPISPYALQKLVGEQFAKMFTDLYKVPIISLRYFNVFGPRLDFKGEYGLVVGRFLQQKCRGGPLTIYDDGKQTRSFCYVDDAVDATIRAGIYDNLKGGEVINIGGKKSISVNYLASLIGGPTTNLPPRAGDVRHTRSDNSLAKTLLNWSSATSFEEGLEKTKEWFKDSPGT